MAPVFSKEAILQGCVDHLCLVCERYLRSERDVCLHVSSAEHTRNLDGTDYVDKYRNDRIRKVKKWYYCEFCNVLVSTVTAVALHVKETRHVANKASQMIAREDDAIVTGNLTISDEAWHGFIDNTCIICDEEFEDQDVHKSEPTHVINLIQSKVSDDNCYRMIDDSTFHCLTCSEVVVEITEHLDETKHKQILQENIKTTLKKRKENKKYIKVTHTHDKNLKLNANSVKNDNKQSSDILDSIPAFQKNHININFESSTAVCTRCSLNLEFSCKEIEKHIEEHKNNLINKTTKTKPVLFENDEKNQINDCETLVTSPVLRSSEKENENAEPKPTEITEQIEGLNSIRKTAEENGLTYIAIGNKVFCELCSKKIPSSIKNIIGHVNGESHISRRPTNSKDNQIGKKCNFSSVPFIQFFSTGEKFRSTLTTDIVVNNKYCIDILSFYYLTKIGAGQIRCQVCEVNLHVDDMDDHIQVERHDRAMKETAVLIRTDLELIREVRSGTYQCGYCNIYDSWARMEDHLKSSDHKESETFARRRLSQYSSIICKRRFERRIQEAFLEVLFS